MVLLLFWFWSSDSEPQFETPKSDMKLMKSRTICERSLFWYDCFRFVYRDVWFLKFMKSRTICERSLFWYDFSRFVYRDVWFLRNVCTMHLGSSSSSFFSNFSVVRICLVFSIRVPRSMIFPKCLHDASWILIFFVSNFLYCKFVQYSSRFMSLY